MSELLSQHPALYMVWAAVLICTQARQSPCRNGGIKYLNGKGFTDVSMISRIYSAGKGNYQH
jgi:hypothetical protein